ncbi:hypothetical protein D3C86_1151290 [compost metagenome]
MHICHGIQADAVGIGNSRGRDTLQQVILKVFAIGDRRVVIPAAIPSRTGTDTAGDLLTRAAKGDVDAQVDAPISVVTRTETAGPVEQRQPPVSIAAKQLSALGPAKINARAFGVAFAVGHPGIDRTFAGQPMIDRQR